MALEIESEASRGIDRVAAAEAARTEAEACAGEGGAGFGRCWIATPNCTCPRCARAMSGGGSWLRRWRVSWTCRFPSWRRGISKQAIDEKVKAGRPVLANRIRAALRAFFRVGAQARVSGRGTLGLAVGDAVKERARERAPSVAECQAIFEGVRRHGAAVGGRCFRLLVSDRPAPQRNRGAALGRKPTCRGGASSSRVKRRKMAKAHVTHMSETVGGNP